jgi:hypothetical protein
MSLLHFLDVPLEDETLYSHIARLRHLNAVTNVRTCLRSVFGIAHIRLSADLPVHLDKVVQTLGRIPAYRDVLTLASGTTHYPYYRLFMPEERWQQLWRRIDSHKPAVKVALGLTAQRFGASTFLRSCQECDRESWTRFGTLYWHRAHQLPGVQLCVHHGTPLRVHGMQSRDSHPNELRLPPTDAIGVACEPPSQSLAVSQRIAQISYEALQRGANSHPVPNRSQRIAAMRSQLRDQGFCRGARRVRWRDLSAALLDRHAGFVGWQVGERISKLKDGRLSWLPGPLCDQTHLSHPLCHIILIELLFPSVAIFMEAALAESLNSYPCTGPSLRPDVLNVEATHTTHSGSIQRSPYTATSTLITTVSDTLHEARHDQSALTPDVTADPPVEASPDSVAPAEDLRTPTAIPKDGANRRNCLPQSTKIAVLELLAVGERQRSIGIRLGVSEAYVCRTLSSAPQVKQLRADAIFSQKRTRHRKVWTGVLQRHPMCGVRQVCVLAGGAYAWLWRNDGSWLRANMPKRRTGSSRVDWDARSAELAQKIDLAGKEMREPRRRERISRHALMKAVGQANSISANLDRMPAVYEALERQAETVAQFQRWRLASALAELLAEGDAASDWKIRQRASARGGANFGQTAERH